ncbi:hypothetical protein K435DRAFT_846115 [Dendrothele bispora CBS 962.96]|uniref:DUF6534 domain-containing protein n=1 Tax=Dendrothele bispora (strain CBS 962.96) TaxID=1314807 RepID=A0A4S8KPM8_DENBC|nr:hypothetical protein K435DRAFT_846115 [Dendrothele bispora CBS 962.96]
MSTPDLSNGTHIDTGPHRTRSQEIALGMTMLGLIFSSILYGITLSQIYTYFRRFPRDSIKIKALVVSIVILDVVSVVLVCHACWYYLITNGKSTLAVWSLNAELAISMFISGIAEGFMAYRVWMLSGRRRLLTFVLLAFAVAHFISGEVSAAQFLKLERFAKFASVKVPSILRLSTAAICDTGIAISLCYFLQQKRTGYKRTDEIIDRLMLFSINSGLITSVTSIACLITYLVVPKTWVYLALCFLISRLYGNTFLNALNSRHILQSDDNDMDTPVIPQFRSTGIIGRGRLGRGMSVKTPTQIDVLVVTETLTQSDSCSSRAPSEKVSGEFKRIDTRDSSINIIQEVPRAVLPPSGSSSTVGDSSVTQ